MIQESGMGYHNSESPSRSFLLCAVVLALMSSFIAMIVSSVGLARSRQSLHEVNILTNHQTVAAKGSERVWTIAIGDFGVNLEYLDEVTYQIKGYNVDVVHAVCQLANKSCLLTWDVNERCWDSQSGQQARGGDGLMSGWYDACTGWVKTPARSLTFDFTRAFVKRKDVAIYVNNTRSDVDYRNLSGLKVGFIDGWAADEHCLARYDGAEITGSKLPTEQIFHFSSGMGLIQALYSGAVLLAGHYVSPSAPIGYNTKWLVDELVIDKMGLDHVKLDKMRTRPTAHITIRPITRPRDKLGRTDWTPHTMRSFFKIDVAFAIKLPQLESGFRRITPSDFNNKCYLDGAGMMTRKSNVEFLTWWNEAWGRLVGTTAYDAICDRLKTEHGHKPGSDARGVCIGY